MVIGNNEEKAVNGSSTYARGHLTDVAPTSASKGVTTNIADFVV